MKLKDKYGAWACVAGAGEGLGKAFSESLAKRGLNLILIDQKLDLLDSTKALLEANYQIEIDVLNLDLIEDGIVDLIMQSLQRRKCRFLIYNAAYGPVKPFLSNTETELQRYLAVNIETQLILIHRFIHNLKDETAGVLMMSSLAGFRGTQFVVPYAATKAFIWNMAEGLHYEFKDAKIDFSVCVAGATDTPNFRSTHPKKSLFAPKARDPKLVAEEALSRFGTNLFIFPGVVNKLTHFILTRILPRKFSSKIHNSTMQKMYG